MKLSSGHNLWILIYKKHNYHGKYINYLGNFCQLLTIANILNPDQVQQKVSRDQYPNRLTIWVGGFKSLSLYRFKQCRPRIGVLIVCFQ